MREVKRSGLGAFLVAFAFLVVSVSRGQTWIGTGPNSNFYTPGNWQSGIVPPNTGVDSATFTTPGVTTSTTINLNSNADLLGMTFQSNGSNYTDFAFNPAGGILTIGTGGIASSGAGFGNAYIGVPLVLAGSQNWGSVGNETIDVYGSSLSGTGNLTTNGYVYLQTNLTFSGGITLNSGYLSLGGNSEGGNNTFAGGINVLFGTLNVYNYYGVPTPAGTGPISMASGTQLSGYYATLPNAITIGSALTILSNDAQGGGLTLNGPITTTSASTNVNIYSYSTVTAAGSFTGPSSTMLTISGDGAQLPPDGGSQLLFEGTLSQVSGVTVNNAALVLAPSGLITSSGLLGLSSTGLQVVNFGYLGLDGEFASTPGAVSTFLSTYGSGTMGLGNNINGTLGFDSYNDIADPGGTNTFSDAIDLTHFSSAFFLGLGSSSTAILSGTITPTSENTYPFGGGGGTLTVSSNLGDNSGTALVVNAGPAPLTLILQGTNGYTGGTYSNGGVLIFDSPLPSTGSITLNGGYAGYDENATIATAQNFVDKFTVTGSGGVIGFDSANVGDPRTIADGIDLSAFFAGNNPFIGTATAVTLSGSITPDTNAAPVYKFTGVKGGLLTIASVLNVTAASAVIGLSTPIESNGSESVVTIDVVDPVGHPNTYAGGTTFNSGTLFIEDGSALGTGAITVPDPNYYGYTPYLAPYTVTDVPNTVTLTNPISIGSLNSGPGLTVGSYYTSDMLILNGVISDHSGPGQLGIDGPVTLGAANTYTGGTTITGDGNAVVLVGNDAAFGIGGTITVQETGVIAPLGAARTLGNPIQLNTSLTLGQVGNTNLLTLNGTISGSSQYDDLYIYGPVTLNGANTFPGSVFVYNTTVAIGNPGALGTGAVQLNGSQITDNYSAPAFLDLNGDSESAINLQANAVLTLNTDSNSISPPADYSGSINGDATNQVVVAGTGVEDLTGVSTYSGGTTVVSGRLIAGAPGALGTGGVTVDGGAGLEVSNPTVITNAITLAPGATVSGEGTFSPPAGLSIAGSGTTISPGSDGIFYYFVDTLSVGTSLSFGSGGQYTFDVQDASGTAGSGYDTVNVAGSLTIGGSPFTIFLRSVTPTGFGYLGAAASFNPTMSYSWTLVNATGGISMFNAADFSVNTSAFQNSLAGGSFMVGESGNLLTLNFTPVPEPSTWALMAPGFAAVLLAGVRRSRRA
jgi:fibronectin-binding autotransporter adhesin